MPLKEFFYLHFLKEGDTKCIPDDGESFRFWSGGRAREKPSLKAIIGVSARKEKQGRVTVQGWLVLITMADKK